MEMKKNNHSLLAAERRIKIYEWIRREGSADVPTLVEAFGVGANTIRHDLNILHSQGKLLRSHGGAVAREQGAARPPYSQLRDANLEEKALIGEAALRFLPETGSIFIGPGSTPYQLAVRIPHNTRLNIVTTSPEVALLLATNTDASVDLLGGHIRVSDCYATDCSLSEDAVEMLYWDVAFMGAAGVDLARGITCIDKTAAVYERKLIQRANKTVLMVDSSKIGRCWYAKLGPVGLTDVLVTDNGIDTETIDLLRAEGVEVVIAS